MFAVGYLCGYKMAVAPSFQKLELAGEPFAEGDKEYIMVRYPDGHTRKVRWYEEPMKKIRSTKDVLGFSKGYITIFKGDTYSLLEWFQESTARYHKFFGWYFISEEELPEIPAGVTPIQLKWEDVAFADEDQLRPESQIKEHIDTLMYDPSPSKWQGEVGERIDRLLTVTKVIPIEGYYGNSTMHIFSDSEENVYIWTTATKTLEAGKTYVIRGTVKEHKSFKNVPQTILTRCAICQDKTV